MTTLGIILIAGALGLALANGANDNFKGVATLLGTGTAGYRKALGWATACTLAGSLASVFLARGLVAAFSGKGLVPDGVASRPGFAGAVAVGAVATIWLATRLGLPVSTTHALMGALVGAGLAAPGSAVALGPLGRKFALPLLVSPFLAAAGAALLHFLLHRARRRLNVPRETCVCVGREVRVLGVESSCMEAVGALEARVGVESECFERYGGRLVGVSVQGMLDRLHVLSAGAVSFARGLNDTPKVAALLLLVPALSGPAGLLVVGLAMAAGGWVGARKVAHTMSRGITAMNHGQGFAANLVTAFLVIVASRWGLPVSTTHVSCGSLFGIGAVSGRAGGRSILRIVAAWVTTLPLAAALAAAVRILWAG